VVVAPAPVAVGFVFTPWCELSVDGRALGRVPPRREAALLPGRHRVVCTQEPATWLRYATTLTVEAGHPMELHQPLVAAVTVRIAVTEGDQAVIDGTTLSRGATHALRPASYKVTVLRAGAAVSEAVVDVARPCTLRDVPRLHCAP
jgi:hypothetical protein